MATRDQLPDAALVAFASAGYLALLVAGLGIASLVTDSDVISTRGVGLAPAYLAAGAAILAFALLLRGSIAREQPSYMAALGTAIGSAAAHLILLAGATLVSSGDLGTTVGVVGEVLLGWVALVFFAAALVAAWAAIAVRRTRMDRPRWPWEDRP